MGRKQARQEEYRIRDILDFKEQEGQEYLLIWWEGYPKREATWEPVENIAHVYDYNEFYQRLKQNYHQRLPEANHQSNPQKESSHHVNPVSKHDAVKSKPIAKRKRKRKQSFDVFHSDSDNQQSVQQPPKEVPIQQLEQVIIAQPVPESVLEPVAQPVAEPIKTSIMDEVVPPALKEPAYKPAQQMSKEELKRHLKNAPVVKIEIRIKQFKGLPYEGRQLSRILGSFKRAGEEVYLVQLEGEAEPVVVHQDMLRARWARKFAEYLLSKQK